MYKIEWDESLSVGIDMIDEDHKNLIKTINKLHDAIESYASDEILSEVFDDLDKYVHDHFTSEEIIMKKHNYPALDEHILMHQDFANRIPELKAEIFSARFHEIALNTYEYLADWLINHIIKEDMKYTQYIHSEVHKKKSKAQAFIQKKITQKFTIKIRLLLIITIPIFVILMLFFYTSKENYAEYQMTKTVHKNSLIFISMNKLSNALQLERGLSVANLSAKDGHFLEKLLLHRTKVDSLYGEYLKMSKKNLSMSDYTSKKNILDTQFMRIKNCRIKLDAKQSNSYNILNHYTKLINTLLSCSKQLSLNVPDKVLRTSLSTLYALLYQKELMGLRRAIGTELLQLKSQSKLKTDFLELKGEEGSYRKSFLEQATNEQKKIFNELRISNIIPLIGSYEKDIVSLIIDHTETHIDSAHWFENMTKGIEYLKTFIDKEITAMANLSLKRENELTNSLIILAATLLLMGIIFSYFIFLLEKSIYKPIQKLSNVLIGLSRGERNLHFLEKQKDDEFGLLQNAYESLRIELIKGDKQEIKIVARDQKAKGLKKLAFVDSLTGAFNRRKFEESFNHELARSKRYKLDLSLLMIDIDHFKKINDTYGHDIGDIVLKNIVILCQNNIRSVDTLFRFGGEEFMIILPQTNTQDAEKYAQRLCKLIEKSKMTLDENSIKITVSIGITGYKYNSDNKIKTIMKRADEALYKAKKQGRNRVVLCD